MVNQTCPYVDSCENLINKFCCDKCAWYEFDFSKIDTTEIVNRIVEDKEQKRND